MLSSPGRKRRPSPRNEGASQGFPRAAAPMGVFSRGTTTMSGSLSCGAREVRSPCAWRGRVPHGSRVMEGDRASRRVEEGLSRSFSGCGGKPSFPSTSARNLRELPRVPLRVEGYCGVGVASPDSTGFGQWQRASCRGEAGSSGFLSVSDSDRRVPAELVQESQASSCVEECISACLPSCSRGDRPLVELYVDPELLSG